MNLSFNVRGLVELERALGELAAPRVIGDVSRDGVAATAKVIADGAEDRLRSRGGRLGARLAGAGAITARREGIDIGGGGSGVLAAAAAMEFGAKRDRYNFYGRHPFRGNSYAAPLGTNVPGFYVGWSSQRNAERAVEEWGEILDRAIVRHL